MIELCFQRHVVDRHLGREGISGSRDILPHVVRDTLGDLSSPGFGLYAPNRKRNAMEFFFGSWPTAVEVYTTEGKFLILSCSSHNDAFLLIISFNLVVS